MWKNEETKKIVIFLLLIFTIFPLSQSRSRSSGGEERSRQGKLFSLFNIVQFKNDGCYSTSTISSSVSDGRRNGTCFTTQECIDRKGSASGSCAAGFGVCCVFLTSSCGSTVSENCTYIRNPGFPSAATTLSTCNYNVQKCDPEVCTLRLDFESFNLLAGSTTVEDDPGFSCQDEFTVAGLGTGQTIPIICGANNGQHIYVDMGAQPGDTATLSFTFGAGTSGNNRLWEIKVTQISLKSDIRPPSGCLQYLFGNRVGTFETFNFASGSGHLVNQNYAVCIRQEFGYCCVQYRICDASGAFSLDTNGPEATGTSKIETGCTGDFIQIEGSASICSLMNTVNRFCGTVFADTNIASINSIPLCDCTSPFVVNIRTDNAKDATDTRISRGLCLTFTHLPCGGANQIV